MECGYEGPDELAGGEFSGAGVYRREIRQQQYPGEASQVSSVWMVVWQCHSSSS